MIVFTTTIFLSKQYNTIQYKIYKTIIFARHPVGALHTVLVPLPVGMRPCSKLTNGLHGTLFVPYKKKKKALPHPVG